MSQDFTVYFKNRRVVIAYNLEQHFEGSGCGLFVGAATRQIIPKLLEIFQTRPEIQNLFIGSPTPDKQFGQFTQRFGLLEAAGGLVQNESGEFLLIFRRNRWDLPKGKVEKGEELEAAALREVEEETGVASLSVLRPLTVTHHAYEEGGKLLLKRTTWYAMRCCGPQRLTPQVEEDITGAEWVAGENLPGYLSLSYDAIRAVFASL